MRTQRQIIADICAAQRWRMIGDLAAAAAVALAIVIAVALATR